MRPTGSVDTLIFISILYSNTRKSSISNVGGQLTYRDNLRGFFEQCFAALVARIFGYNGPSWLAMVAASGKETDARALLRLLSPTGPLFLAIYNADADGSTRFHFPRQRLPVHTQLLLASPAAQKILAAWPQYASLYSEDPSAAGKGHIHVSVFQYFCYWFAFYAIKGSDGSSGLATRGSSRMMLNDYAFIHSKSSDGGRLGPKERAPYQNQLGVPTEEGLAPSLAQNDPSFSVRRAAKEALHHLSHRHSPSDREKGTLASSVDVETAIKRPYAALLRQFMAYLLPRPTDALQSPVGSPEKRTGTVSRLQNSAYTSPMRGSQREVWYGDGRSRGLIFYSTMIEFWLKDANEPVPLHSTEATRAAATSYEPPSEELLDSLTEMVRYTTVCSSPPTIRPAQATPTAWLPPSPVMSQNGLATVGPQRRTPSTSPSAGPARLGPAAQPGAQLLFRQLFRFFYRAFSLWPDQRSIKPLLRPFLACIAPWQTGSMGGPQGQGALNAHREASGFTHHITSHLVSELVHRVSHSGQSGMASSETYSPELWESHVLSNIPFYLILIPLFLERCISRVSIRGESAVQDVMRVIAPLEASNELVDLLRVVERDVNKYAASHPRRAEGPFADYMPWLYDQVLDWQVAASINVLGEVSSQAGRAQQEYSMFSINMANGEKWPAALIAKDLLDLSSSILKPEAFNKFSKALEKVLPIADVTKDSAAANLLARGGFSRGGEGDFSGGNRDAILRHQCLPRSSWKDVCFKGDELMRPVASFEIAALVRVLVAVSQWVNKAIGLEADSSGESPTEPETRLQEIVFAMRRRGWRVNLRPLGDLRTLFWLPVAIWTAWCTVQGAIFIIAALVRASGRGA